MSEILFNSLISERNWIEEVITGSKSISEYIYIYIYTVYIGVYIYTHTHTYKYIHIYTLNQ